MDGYFYSFPILDVDTIVAVFSELDVPLSKEVINKPPPGYMRDVYERIVLMMAGMKKEDLVQKQFNGVRYLEDPELHDDSIPEINLRRHL